MVNDRHFHIRWDTGVLDWERHATRAEAEESAKQLARLGEKYKIEKVQEDCALCEAFERKVAQG